MWFIYSLHAMITCRLNISVKEAHVSQIVSKAADYNSSSSQLQVDDLACQLAPGGYIISCTRDC